MRAVVQRVSQASVEVEKKVVGSIDEGLLILLAIHKEDSAEKIPHFAKKIAEMRIFENEAGKMHHSLIDLNGGALIISQFTLYADTEKGRRPSFFDSAPPEMAEPLYLQFAEEMKKHVGSVETGTFGAYMKVELLNNGPVTIVLDA